MLEFGVCSVCGQKHFIDYKQFLEDEDNYKEKLKTYTGEAAQREYDKWQLILSNTNYGSFAKQFFYYGAYKQDKDGSFKTYRRNFNNEDEYLFNQKVKIYII